MNKAYAQVAVELEEARRKELNARRGRSISRTMMRKLTDRRSEAQRKRAEVVGVVGTERALARLLHCSYTSIGEYFRGDTPIPKALDETFRLLYPELSWWRWPAGVSE